MDSRSDDGVMRQFADGTMTVDDAVKFSGVGRTSLYKMMNAGDLAFTKVGVRRLIARRALVELLAKHAASAAVAQPA
jgi:excisionase family DNA binding protein